jgi:hypothetical protein
MTSYKTVTREPDARFRDSPLAKKLITVTDAAVPKGLSEAERLIFVDVFNSIFVLPFADEAQAKAAATAAAKAFLAESSIDESGLEKYDDQD